MFPKTLFKFRAYLSLISAAAGSVAVPPPVRYYARAAKNKTTGAVSTLFFHKLCVCCFVCFVFDPLVFTGPESQLSDLPATMLKMEYAAVPAIQTYVHTDLPCRKKIVNGNILWFLMNGHCYANRTDDVVKRLLSLEFASQVSFQVPQVHFHSASFFCCSQFPNCVRTMCFVW